MIKQGEMLCTTTIRIEAYNERIASTGTGFYYSIGEENNYLPVIITNRHVIEGMTTINIVLTKSDSQGNRVNEHIKFNIEDIRSAIVWHPQENVDLCAIALSPVIEELRKDSIEIHTYYITEGIIPNADQLNKLDAIEEIIMVGYPNGLWDEVNNMPIIRRGVTATHPKLNYNGKNEFLIDAACFPGSSGSPVFYLDKSFKTELPTGILGHPIYLLGILYAGPQSRIEGLIEFPGNSFNMHTRIPNNLGYVIKSNALIPLCAQVKKKMDIS